MGIQKTDVTIASLPTRVNSHSRGSIRLIVTFWIGDLFLMCVCVFGVLSKSAEMRGKCRKQQQKQNRNKSISASDRIGLNWIDIVEVQSNHWVLFNINPNFSEARYERDGTLISARCSFEILNQERGLGVKQD